MFHICSLVLYSSSAATPNVRHVGDGGGEYASNLQLDLKVWVYAPAVKSQHTHSFEDTALDREIGQVR
jgi:hypothetical protein